MAANFYPRPPRGGRLVRFNKRLRKKQISIHALREEGDSSRTRQCPTTAQFLSTPSARRATQKSVIPLSAGMYFYPRPPRGGRRAITRVRAHVNIFLSTPSARRATSGTGIVETDLSAISIHALREEGDHGPTPARAALGLFLSTPSARRATPPEAPAASNRLISIHALREEGDLSSIVKWRYIILRISIHALREEGDRSFLSPFAWTWRFLSTPSARRATIGVVLEAADLEISIHALREEGDPCQLAVRRNGNDFYPRPPRGGRPRILARDGRATRISIHALREEGDAAV